MNNGSPSNVSRLMLIVVEVILILACAGLLLAIWLPAIVGAPTNAAP